MILNSYNLRKNIAKVSPAMAIAEGQFNAIGDNFNIKVEEKSGENGKDLKAQELPGLWNGAMADWNTIFVEVPTITFNPVKTIFDLLRVEHRN